MYLSCAPFLSEIDSRNMSACGPNFPNGEPGPSLYCAVIVKTVDEKTRSKTGINELLRD